MSNKVNLTLTKFVTLDDFGNETPSFSYGYRIYDDYATAYNNTFFDKKELTNEVNEENFWEVLENHDEFSDIDPMDEGMFFNGTWYDGEEIKEISEEVERRTSKRISD